MNSTHAPEARSQAVERYISRIEAHLVRFAEGHDPLGHLFGIERLARGARSEWREILHEAERERHRQ
jgi:hypothetical protein